MGLLEHHGSDRTVAADYLAWNIDRLFHLEEVQVWESSLCLVGDIWHYTTSWKISGKNWMLVASLVNIERWISPKLIGIWHFGASAMCHIVRIVKFNGLSHIWTFPLRWNNLSFKRDSWQSCVSLQSLASLLVWLEARAYTGLYIIGYKLKHRGGCRVVRKWEVGKGPRMLTGGELLSKRDMFSLTSLHIPVPYFWLQNIFSLYC